MLMNVMDSEYFKNIAKSCLENRLHKTMNTILEIIINNIENDIFEDVFAISSSAIFDFVAKYEQLGITIIDTNTTEDRKIYYLNISYTTETKKMILDKYGVKNIDNKLKDKFKKTINFINENLLTLAKNGDFELNCHVDKHFTNIIVDEYIKKGFIVTVYDHTTCDELKISFQ